MTNRIDWLDAARGIGILLVVAGHALGGIIDSPLGEGQVWQRQLFFAIYSFHMPLFFLLSGLLVTRRLGKGEGRFLKSLLPSVVWPYFLWSAVQYTLIFGMGSLVNRPAESYWPVILSLPWNTVSQFWFLYALFWMHVLATAVVPRAGSQGLVLFALALKALALVLPMPVPARLVCTHLLFYAIGVWLTPGGLMAPVIAQPRWMRLALFPAAAIGAIVLSLTALPDFAGELRLPTAASPEIANLAWRFQVLSAAVFGVAATVGIASLPVVARSNWLAYLGRMTMAIFVLHVMFIAGTRIVLTRLGLLSDADLLVAPLVVAGVLGPLLVERALRPFKLQKFLGF